MKLIDKVKQIIRKCFYEGNVYYINGSETLLPPLDKVEEIELLEKSNNGCLESRNKLIEHNLRLVVYVAKRFETNSFNLEDLISIGTIGLIKAISTFNCDKNIKLATYASRCIENEILMFLRKKSKMKVEVSLDEPLKVDGEGNELLLSDVLGSDSNDIFDEIEDVEKRKLLYDAIDTLRPREKLILKMRFGLFECEEMTQKDVADSLGISQSYISRLEKRIIKKLYNKMNK
jgi:RNA polymerase sporulation-specific sigma factor